MTTRMLYSPLATLAIAVSLGALLWAGLPSVMGRTLARWEALAATAVIFALLEWWRARRLRREREQTESLRDSALW